MPDKREAQDLIRELLMRELDTVNVYSTMVSQARTPTVRALIAEITAQEKHHIAEAVDLLARYDASQSEALAAAGIAVHAPPSEADGERSSEEASAAVSEGSTASAIFEPSGVSVAMKPNETMLAAALRSDVDIRHVCGGQGKCGTCRVEVLVGDALSTVTDAERRWLGDTAGAGWRLACQTRVLGPVRVRVPAGKGDEKKSEKSE